MLYNTNIQREQKIIHELLCKLDWKNYVYNRKFVLLNEFQISTYDQWEFGEYKELIYQSVECH